MIILVSAPYHEEGLKELEQLFGEVAYRPWKQQGRAYNENELINLLRDSQADTLGMETIIPKLPEEVNPENSGLFLELYKKWKQAGHTFKQMSR